MRWFLAWMLLGGAVTLGFVSLGLRWATVLVVASLVGLLRLWRSAS